MHVVTGTEHTRTEHSTGAALAGVLLSLGLPAVVALAGIWQFGWNAISWQGAIVWGIVGALALWLTVVLFRRGGATRLPLLDLLGSLFARSGSQESFWVGMMVHLANGALLGVAYVYGAALMDWPTNWFTGLLWGVLVWALGLVLMTSIGGVHPEIRDGLQDDPGPAATNFGLWTPGVYLAGHVFYGVLLGGLYTAWPLWAQ